MTQDDATFAHAVRLVEALIFASSDPVSDVQIAEAVGESGDVDAVTETLRAAYEARGVQLVRVAEGWAFRTAPDLSKALDAVKVEPRKLSRAALETLAIVAYHQPVTRADIEDIRGVSVSRGTLDQLLEIGWIGLRGRRRAPGRPITYGTTPAFLDHFGLAALDDLPGLAEMKAAGLLDPRLADALDEVRPRAEADDEDPLDDADQAAFVLDAFEPGTENNA